MGLTMNKCSADVEVNAVEYAERLTETAANATVEIIQTTTNFLKLVIGNLTETNSSVISAVVTYWSFKLRPGA